MQVNYLGYSVEIMYDDYDRYETEVQNLEEIEAVCKNLVNRDDYFDVTYRKKYQLENKEVLYGESTNYQIENINFPKRELLLRKFNELSQSIQMAQDIDKNNLKACRDILNQLLDLD
jgi:hypothetical protein